MANSDFGTFSVSLWWSDKLVLNVIFSIKQVVWLVRKLFIQISLMILRLVGSGIKLQSSGSYITSFNFWFFGSIIKSPLSKLLSCDEK